MDLPLGIVFGLLAMLGYGLSTAVAQVPLKSTEILRVVFFRGIFSSSMLFLGVLLFWGEYVFSPVYVLLALAISFVGYAGLISFYKALKVGDIGVVTPIANSSVVFTVLLSVLFFAESLGPVQVFSIGLIVCGIVLISVDFGDLRNSSVFDKSSGVVYALITCLLWGCAFFLFKIPVTLLGPILSSFVIETGNMIYSGIGLKFSGKGFGFPSGKNMKYIFFVALFGALGTLAFNYGVGATDVSIVAALTFANPVVSAVYARVVYKEKLGGLRYFAMGLILLGIVLISYF